MRHVSSFYVTKSQRVLLEKVASYHASTVSSLLRMGNASCCGSGPKGRNQGLQLEVFCFGSPHVFKLDRPMIESTSNTMRVKGYCQAGVEKHTATLSLLCIDHSAYVLDLGIEKPGSKAVHFGKVLPIFYVTNWYSLMAIGFEFFASSEFMPKEGSEFGDSSYTIFRFGVKTDEEGHNQGFYKSCLVEARNIHLERYKGFNFPCETGTDVTLQELKGGIENKAYLNGKHSLPLPRPVLMKPILKAEDVYHGNHDIPTVHRALSAGSPMNDTSTLMKPDIKLTTLGSSSPSIIGTSALLLEMEKSLSSRRYKQTYVYMCMCMYV
ncbi:hypothetical protein AAMO2058_001326500 [Amorphochlora amoebiformis]